MLKLFDYPSAFAELDRAIEEAGGELTPGIEAWLDALESSFEDKVRAYCGAIRNYSKTAESYREEARKLAGKAASAERTAERLKARLKEALDSLKLTGVDAAPFKVRVVKNSQPSVKLREGFSLGTIPPGLVRTKVELDKVAALKALAAEPLFDIYFAVDYGTHLRID